MSATGAGGDSLVVQVRDANGQLLREIPVPASALASGGSNAEDVGITDPVDLALLFASPEVCPYDCDHCRG